jgi:hypothetical protein
MHAWTENHPRVKTKEDPCCCCFFFFFSPLQICVCLIAKNEATACNTLGDYKKRGRSEGKIDNN